MAVTRRLRVDPVACDAFGHCAELAPELIALDEWGYPVIDERPIPPELIGLAEAAVRICPGARFSSKRPLRLADHGAAGPRRSGCSAAAELARQLAAGPGLAASDAGARGPAIVATLEKPTTRPTARRQPGGAAAGSRDRRLPDGPPRSR